MSLDDIGVSQQMAFISGHSLHQLSVHIFEIWQDLTVMVTHRHTNTQTDYYNPPTELLITTTTTILKGPPVYPSQYREGLAIRVNVPYNRLTIPYNCNGKGYYGTTYGYHTIPFPSFTHTYSLFNHKYVNVVLA